MKGIRTHSIYLGVFVLFLCFSPRLYAQSNRQTSPDEYVVGPENVLQIDVYYGKDEKLSQKLKVSSKGYITFPLLGEVEVAGLTVSELEKRLAFLLEKDYLVNPQVSVFVEQYSTVSIFGEVEKPGVYPIEGNLSVMELISKAEGFTKIASPNKVKIIRTNQDGTKEEIMVKVKNIINKQESDVPLKAGDVIVVPESMF